MAKVQAKLTEKQKKSIQNKAHRDLLQHRANWELFQKDIEALGNPSDYKNQQNYKNKVNELRSKHGVTWLRDLKSYNEQFKKRDAELLARVSNRYVGTKLNRAGELLIGAGDMSMGGRIQPKFSKESGLGYKINPNYIERYDTTGETQLKKDAAEKLKIENQRIAEEAGADERGETQWGPGGQPTSSAQYTAAGIDLNNLNAGTLLGNSKLTIEGNVSPDYEREVARDLNPNEVRTWSTDGGKETVYKNFGEFDEKDASGAKAKWLADTANSPAAQAGLSEDQRWAARQNHLKWLKDKKNKKKLTITSPMDMD